MTFEILFTLFYNFLTKYAPEQLRSTSHQSQFFKRIDCQNVAVNHKSNQCVNKNIFSFDIALIMNLITKWASGGLGFSFKGIDLANYA